MSNANNTNENPGHITKEEAWRKIQDYIETHNYDWTFERIKNDYQKYYLKGAYCSYTLCDVIKNNEIECQLLFG